MVQSASSRAFDLCAYHFSVCFFPSSDLLPSKDAVDDIFQHTLDVLAGIIMGHSNSRAQELSIDMLN